jgi:1,2-diacylglycerol 3-alpha-glucosyltransferase
MMPTPLRVLMVSDVYFPRINGVSTSIETFRTALPAHGVRVGLVAPRYDDETDSEDIVRLPGRRLPRDPEDRLMQYRHLRRAVDKAASTYDLIHIQTPFAAHYAGLHAARRLHKPVLATYHTLFEEYLQHYIPFLPARALRALARRFSRGQCDALDAVVVPSTAMANRLRAYGVDTALHVLPTGLPEDVFRPGDRARFRACHGIAEQTPVALFVGRVAHEKNIGFLLDALAVASRDLPELILLVTGEGPALADLRRHAARLGLQDAVRFLGYLDRRNELPDAYAAADVFVFASHTETQGLVLLEAMAQGCPVVAQAVMGTTDILSSERGCRIAANDPAAFARVMLEVLREPDLHAKLALEARRHAREWSDAALAERMARLYRALVAHG